jgi:transcription antitermination factor NusG
MKSSWYAVHVRSRHEFKVYGTLQTMAIETFLPYVEKMRQWKDRKKKIAFPLFSGYLFVKLADVEKNYLPVVKVPGVVRILGNGKTIVSVPEEQIQFMHALVESKLPLEVHPYLQEGQNVRIIQGPLRGVVGVLTRKGSDDMLVVSIDLIQKGVSVRVSVRDVEPVI